MEMPKKLSPATLILIPLRSFTYNIDSSNTDVRTNVKFKYYGHISKLLKDSKLVDSKDNRGYYSPKISFIRNFHIFLLKS